MSYGYTGRVLRVDLTNGTIRSEEVDPLVYRKYLGGSAFALYYLLREMKPGIDPLGPDNILIFAPSILGGTPVPGSNRFTVAAKSPLTGAFGESEAGGWWGSELKLAGFDAVIVTGKSQTPVYLWITNGRAEIRKADHVWGKTTGETEDLIREELGNKRVRIAAIGPAGEKLVRYACVINNLKHANGRSGLGAVMGSKHLKAVAVFGDGKVDVKDGETVKAICADFAHRYRDNLVDGVLYDLGTPSGILPLNAVGILPTRNFVSGYFDGAESISGETLKATISAGHEGCYACPVRCKRVVSVQGMPYDVDPRYGGPEYETIAAFGSLCGVKDLVAVSKANEMCNAYSLDTISTGVCIAFAMECFENGILSQQDTRGLELRFGNADAMLRMVQMIADREGLGDILAEGVARAARTIGKGAERYAMHVKGQELPLQEPRGKVGQALAWAISPTGADHMEAEHDPNFATYGPPLESVAPLGLHEPVDSLDYGPKKVRLFVYTQYLWNLYNSLGICDHIAAPTRTLTLHQLVDVVRAVTGWDTSLWELMKVGERVSAMARIFNIREGFTHRDDTVPERFFEPLADGAMKGAYLDKAQFSEALRDYYEMMGWDRESGIPRRGKLLELDLDWLLE